MTRLASDDPVRAADRLRGTRGRVLLHSARDDDGCGQWSFVACRPVRTLEVRAGQLVIRDAAGAVIERAAGDPLAVLDRELIAAERAHGTGDHPHPIAVGYLGYDLGRCIEDLGGGPALGDDVADMWIGIYDAVARWGPGGEGAEIVGRDPDARARLARALAAGDHEPAPGPRLGPLAADDGAAPYRDRIAKILEYIAAGDVYQVNLARRFVAPVLRPGDPLAIYRELVQRSPSPYGGMIETDGACVLSGSPELFLRRAGGDDRLETRPIKGTRRRAGDGRDADRARDLLDDPKEQAEHLMIVDLERNDLGRIARLGTVSVDRLAYPVELPTLYHLISRVSCQVRPGASIAEIVRATFPGGSITGAPKIRAMQIIDELEPARRGPYTGALGYFGAGGAIELAIAIRCAVLAGGELRFHVGGGVVADSTADRELEETEEKAAAWRAVTARFSSLSDVGEDEGGGAHRDRHGEIENRRAAGTDHGQGGVVVDRGHAE